MNTETKEIKVTNEIEEETKALIILIPSQIRHLFIALGSLEKWRRSHRFYYLLLHYSSSSMKHCSPLYESVQPQKLKIEEKAFTAKIWYSISVTKELRQF
jgi:hypothetical protein